MNAFRKLTACASGLLAAALWLPAAANESGVTPTEVRLGTLQPLSGPASVYGVLGYNLQAYFAKVNDSGGVAGRKITILLRDDALSPPKTVEQTRMLVEADNVLAIFAQSGTPTGSSVQRYLNSRKVPQLFVMSGSHLFQEPEKYPWSVPGLPTYLLESTIYAKAILRSAPGAKVGVFYQNDDFGKDYLRGVKAGLGDKASTMLVAEQSYELTDPAVDSQILALKAAGVDTLVMGSYSKQTSQALRKMAAIGWKPVIYLSYIGASVSPTFTNAGLENAKGVISATVIKDPTDARWKNDKDYIAWSAWMDKYYPNGDKSNISNVFGYVIANLVEHILRQVGEGLTRDTLMAQVKNVRDFHAPMLAPGVSISISQDNYNIYRKMQLQQFDGTRWQQLGEPLSAD